MNKRVIPIKAIFFDGDGTIWYPKRTQTLVRPNWLYTSYRNSHEYLPKLRLAPDCKKTLSILLGKGYQLFLLSTHPQHVKKAQNSLSKTISYFELEKFFTKYYATQGHKESKGEYILNILANMGIDPKHALMVGDSYRYDYESACKVGVQALLLDRPYLERRLAKEKMINTLSDILTKVT